jgi:CubicO group peptidase (beta-lactamase class C family)
MRSYIFIENYDMKIIFLLLGCFFLAFKGVSQNSVSMRLDSFFLSLHSYSQLNGNVLVAENGKVFYEKSFGFADIENKILNTDSTEFTLASVSKIFTSTAVLQLRDKGKLKLEDRFIKYFAEFPYPDITIRNLLSHTSGVPDYELYERQMNENPNKIFTIKDVLPSLKIWKQPLNPAPGTKWKYSNTNFCLLALLVEKLSGMSFQKYVQQNIFIPSKMNHTYFMNDSVHATDKNRAINYDHPFLYSNEYKNVDSIKQYHWRLYNASGFVGQGNIETTTDDLLKFDEALYSGRLLKPSTLQEAFTPTKLKNGENTNADIGIGKASYGLGWFILNDTTNGKIVWHTGGQPGAVSIFLRNITKKQTIIMFDNNFHKSLFANAVNAIDILNNKTIHTTKISLTQDYGSMLAEKGVDAAFCELQKLQADSTHYYLNEDDMNELGLRLLYEASFTGHDELALEALKLNTLFFPKSFNTYDSYGEALAKTGKKEEAIFMYEKSLRLNPDSKGGKKALEELQKK